MKKGYFNNRCYDCGRDLFHRRKYGRRPATEIDDFYFISKSRPVLPNPKKVGFVYFCQKCGQKRKLLSKSDVSNREKNSLIIRNLGEKIEKDNQTKKD